MSRHLSCSKEKVLLLLVRKERDFKMGWAKQNVNNEGLLIARILGCIRLIKGSSQCFILISIS